jgi:hypothetical protein
VLAFWRYWHRALAKMKLETQGYYRAYDSLGISLTAEGQWEELRYLRPDKD